VQPWRLSTHCRHMHLPGNVLQMAPNADGASGPALSLSAPRKASQLTAPARINISMGGENPSWRAPPIVTLAVQVDRFEQKQSDWRRYRPANACLVAV
jgi:hypothetical protein